ncbi:MAG TPA: hypothetical protein VIO32_05810, partial [Candidatus Baltobacteraceae bacterium]
IDELLRRHIDMEEALIYRSIAEPAEEHRRVLRLLDEIAHTECHAPVYAARVHVLRDVLLRHITEEEAFIFPAYAGVAQVA